MSAQTLKVLATLLEPSGGELSGADVGRAANLKSGTLYPILLRLENAGWVNSKWEEGDPRVLGRPRRRYYWMTGVGRTRALAAFRELQPVLRSLAWAH
jgi:DNA-binding PadR family transcriptional regulator